MATRFAFSSPRGVVFGYRLGDGARTRRRTTGAREPMRRAMAHEDPIASRPAIPVPPPWATPIAWDSDDQRASRLVRTPIGIARLARAAVFAVGLGALYGAVLAMTSGLVDVPEQATQSVPGVLARHPQPEAVAARAGERAANGLARAPRVEGTLEKM